MSERPAPRSRPSGRTPTYVLDQVSQAQLNAGTSYRVRLDEGVFSLSAKQVEDNAYYYVTKRVRGRLFKTYVARNGEVTAGRIRDAVRILLAEIAGSADGLLAESERGARRMRRKSEVTTFAAMDLLHAYEVVLKAPSEEQRELYEIWRENTTKTLALILPPEDSEAWMTFSSQPIDWSSETKAALLLRSIQAYLRVLVAR